jgi:hypothetical protein
VTESGHRYHIFVILDAVFLMPMLDAWPSRLTRRIYAATLGPA